MLVWGAAAAESTELFTDLPLCSSTLAAADVVGAGGDFVENADGAFLLWDDAGTNAGLTATAEIQQNCSLKKGVQIFINLCICVIWGELT